MLPGFGGLHSTVNDLLTVLAAELDYVDTPLSAAMSAMLSGPRPLGWMIDGDSNTIIWHNGETGGYASFIGFDPKRRVGVVVLSNSIISVDDIAFHLLDRNRPLVPQYQEVAVDPRLFDGYLGRYRYAPGATVTITRDGDRLFAEMKGEDRLALFAKEDREFFLKYVDAQITFQVDDQGRAGSLVLRRGGRERFARRIADVPSVRKEIALDAAFLERYVGRYQRTPTYVITITREGDRLFAQATGQPTFEMFAESEMDFFYKAADEQITFVLDEEQQVTGLIVHQFGRDKLARRIVPTP